jgi:hypothetical protein
MIRIETTAEFDAEGRFTVKGTTTERVAPGPHRVLVVLAEAEVEEVRPVEEPPLRKVGNVLVFEGTFEEAPEVVRQRLDEESLREWTKGRTS